jgi:hypothetical protein
VVGFDNQTICADKDEKINVRGSSMNKATTQEAASADQAFNELAERHMTMNMMESLPKWYGWASPIGLGFFLAALILSICIGASAVISALR